MTRYNMEVHGRQFGVELSPEVLFEVLRKYCLLESVLCAAGASASSGLHPKQTYGILDVRKVPAGLKLGDWLKVVQMRHLAEATPWRSRDPEAVTAEPGARARV
ncbi:Hypothetical protein SCF082_LOCUS46883 [Durusdinium trenchii]|uniref:Uncharacterized protein n=1 Tax=Durusdinium trenchii TaxID=1381693 RepID=A0ABP0RHR2_9DINO